MSVTRVDFAKQHRGTHRSLLAFSGTATDAAVAAGVDLRLIELIKIRVSQINGCVFCMRTHTRDALDLGESTDRLSVLPAWRESGYFSPTERAALAVAEGITEIATRPLDDEAYAEVAELLDPDAIAAVSWLAVAMNALNRVAIASRYPVQP